MKDLNFVHLAVEVIAGSVVGQADVEAVLIRKGRTGTGAAGRQHVVDVEPLTADVAAKGVNDVVPLAVSIVDVDGADGAAVAVHLGAQVTVGQVNVAVVAPAAAPAAVGGKDATVGTGGLEPEAWPLTRSLQPESFQQSDPSDQSTAGN